MQQALPLGTILLFGLDAKSPGDHETPDERSGMRTMPWKHPLVVSCIVLIGISGMIKAVRAEYPFGLPNCVRDFGPEVVLNAAVLDAMISAAEPQGTRPHRTYERFFILTKHYLERSRGLLVVPRTDPAQSPLLVTEACTPYPEAPPHIQSFFADLTLEQKRALIAYRDLIWPPGQRVGIQVGSMVRIPAGPLKRGDGQTMTLDAFSIDIYEVTNRQYQQFMVAGGYNTQEFWTEAGWAWLQKQQRHQPSYWDNAQLNAPEQPVVGVSWYEAQAYCRWAGKELPTEWQWEKACRGTDGRPFPWGNEPLPAPASSGPSFTAPALVGSSPQTQSPYGVHDLAGNVLEWTKTQKDHTGVVLRGGSGPSYGPQVGCGVRSVLLPGITANFIGFRCASSAP